MVNDDDLVNVNCTISSLACFERTAESTGESNYFLKGEKKIVMKIYFIPDLMSLIDQQQ